MSRYVGWVSHKVMDDLFNYEPEVREVFQSLLYRLEAEPYKGSTMVPVDKSMDPNWTARVASPRALVQLGEKKYRMVLSFTVGPSQLKVRGLSLDPVDTPEEAGASLP